MAVAQAPAPKGTVAVAVTGAGQGNWGFEEKRPAWLKLGGGFWGV